MNLVCDLFVDGHFEGTIASQKAVTIGKNGEITGELRAHSVIIQGRVEGIVEAERVEIKAGGRIKGSLISSELVIEAKGIFEGDSRLKGGEQASKAQPSAG